MGVDMLKDFFANGDMDVTDAMVLESKVKAYLDQPFIEVNEIQGTDRRITVSRYDLATVPKVGDGVSLPFTRHTVRGVGRAGNGVLVLGLEDTQHVMKTIGNTIHTASLGGLLVDILGYAGAVVIFDLGDWYDGEHTFGLEHSTDGITFTIVGAPDIVGTLPVMKYTFQKKWHTVGYKGGRRYLRAIVDVADAVRGGIYGVGIEPSAGLITQFGG